MGHMRHHAILVTTYSKENCEVAHTVAKMICGDLVSEINGEQVNGYCSFAIFPDGSKEGWEDSDKGDTNRERFIAWLERRRADDDAPWYAWVEVQYGDDDRETRIVHDSDAYQRESDKVNMPFDEHGYGYDKHEGLHDLVHRMTFTATPVQSIVPCAIYNPETRMYTLIAGTTHHVDALGIRYAKVYAHLDDDEIERIAAAVVRMLQEMQHVS